MNQFFVFGALFDYYDFILDDISKLNNVCLVNKENYIPNKFYYLLYKIHNWRMVNRLFPLPGKHIWYKYYFDTKKISDEGYNCFVFYDSNPHVYNKEFLLWIKNKIPKANCTLIFNNSMCNRKFTDIEYFSTYFDNIYSFDKNDCELYGFKYIGSFYSRSKQYKICEKPENDVLFLGADKGRGEQIVKFFKRINKKGGKCDFTVVGLKEEIDGINTRGMSYREYVQRIANTKIIFEILTDGQTGMSLRTMEAIVYNKKLISNNADLKKMKFYSAEDIFIYDNVEDIDIDWIMNGSNETDYHYKGEFSPILLLKKIEENIY